jgi:glycosyltransferase involved in cell wall biosynthesis
MDEAKKINPSATLRIDGERSRTINAPELSFILPVYNEAKIIEQEIYAIDQSLKEKLPDWLTKLELIIVENGSTDNTLFLAYKLSREIPYIKIVHLDKPSYGKSLKKGLLLGEGKYLAILNIHFHNIQFIKQALKILGDQPVDILVGSKNLRKSQDKRPLLRRIIKKSFNFFLRIFFRYQGTDTHGMKIFRKNSITPLIPKCLTESELFDTELLLLAQYNGLKIKEIPIDINRTSHRGIIKRIWPTLRDLIKIQQNIQKWQKENAKFL